MIDCQLVNDYNQSKSFPMSTLTSSMMKTPLHQQQTISNMNINDIHQYYVHNNIDQSVSFNIYTQFPSVNECNEECVTNNCVETNSDNDQSKSKYTNSLETSVNQLMTNLGDNDNELHTLNTTDECDQSQINIYQPNSCLYNSEDLDDEQYMSFMSEINFGTENDKELRNKIMKQKKTSSFGFSVLQRRIEKVKHDLFNLTNKLNTNYSDENDNGSHCYYNLGIGDVIDDNEDEISDQSGMSSELEISEKSWKCPSQCSSKNPFSDLSESTQRILGRLHLKDNEVDETIEDVIIMDEGDIEMEEDELEFTFCNRLDNNATQFTTKGRTLSIIEEQEEYDSSSDESDNGKSTVIERCYSASNNSSTIQSSSHSCDLTDNDAYVTPMSSFRIVDQKQECSDDTEEYFSDLGKYSVSSDCSEESLRCTHNERMDASCTETTIKAEPDLFEQISENGSSLQEKLSSIKDEEDLDSEAEYDNSGWSTEDIPQSVEQSDSLYDKPYRPILKSSLPDLLESSDSYDMDNVACSFMTRHYNKSTDLDEILTQITPYHPPSDRRLSQSMCNLFTARSTSVIRPDDFFQERASFENLLETDLDSGYVSIYKPVMETEILPKVDFSSSMGNVNDAEEKCNDGQTPLINKLRQKAGSVTELRIADSLTKLNIPEWLNLRDDEEIGKMFGLGSNLWSLPVQRSQTLFDNTILSSQQKLRSLPRETLENCIIPTIKPKAVPSMVLPSQLLRQSSQRKLTPIQFCQARQLLLPDKMVINDRK